MNVESRLLGSRLYHWRTEDVFFHWFTFVARTSLELITSRIRLLIRPNSVLDGFINRQVGLFAKFSLWSFSVIKASLVAISSTRSSMLSALVTLLASLFITRWGRDL